MITKTVNQNRTKAKHSKGAGWFYDFAFLIFAFFSIPKFLIRLNQAGSRAQLVKERFGIFSESLKEKFVRRKVIWLHAVSVGEVMAAHSWIELFLKEYPDWIIALSTTTPTGQTVAQTMASERVIVFYAPFDLSWVVRRVLNCIQPKLILLMETEIWPNLISEANFSGVRIGIINGRISPRSFRRYHFVHSWVGSILKKLSFCLVQSERDKGYFVDLGMPASQIFYTGNMKFDRFGVADKVRSEVTKTKPNELIFVAGSTSWNEEELVLRIFSRLHGIFCNLKLVLAPRHPEHLSKVIDAVKRHQFQYKRFSENHSVEPFQVLLVDQMGVLASLYSSADLVFVGGSFVQRGGQNPIEAAIYKKPLLHGPNVFNFHEVYQLLDKNGGAFEVHSEEELFQKSKLLLEHPEIRERMGAQAWSVVQSMKGATARTLVYLSNWIREEKPSVAFVQSYDTT